MPLTIFILNMNVKKIDLSQMKVNLNMLETALLTTSPKNNGEALLLLWTLQQQVLKKLYGISPQILLPNPQTLFIINLSLNGIFQA